MNSIQRLGIENDYEEGYPTEVSASRWGLLPGDVEAYLTWWCGSGCPGGFEEDD